MTDVNDVVLTLTLAAVDASAPAMTAFNARLAEQKALIDAANAKAVTGAKAVGIQADVMSAKYIAAQDKEIAAAIKSADAQIAASQRVTLAVQRDFDKQAAAAKAASDKQASLVTKGIGVGTLLGVGILAGAVDEAAKFQETMQKVQGNTGSSAAQMAVFRQQVLALGAEGPAKIDDIANAFRHVSDLGYRNADAMTVVTEAWKGAIATGGKVEDVANALGTILGNQHAPAAMAAHDIDVIVTAAQQGNLTIPDFANNFSKIGTIAGSVHQPLEQVAAAFATVSRATADPALAQTYMQGMLTHIIAPSGPAIKIMKELAQTVHIDLMPVFAQFANGTITLHDLLVKVKEATGGSAEEIFKLLGGIRGGQAGLILLNNHWQDYNKILGLTETANKNVSSSFGQMQKTASAQLGTLENKVHELAISLGTDLLPAITSVVNDISPLVTGLTNLNNQTHGGVTDVIKYGVEFGGMAYILTKAVIPALAATKEGLFGVAAGEKAMYLANPALWIAAAAVAVASIAQTSAEASAKMGSSWDKVRNSYAEGNITLAEAEQRMRDLHLRVEQSTAAQLDAARADDKRTDALKRQSDIVKALGIAINNLPGSGTGKDFLGGALVGSIGGPTAGKGGGPSDPKAAPAFNIQKEMTHATALIDDWAVKVAADTKTFGAHSDQVAWDMRMLDKWRGTSESLNTEWTTLTSTSKDLKTAGLDPFTKGFQDAQKRLSDATAAIANDYVKGLPVTAAQRKAFDDATASVKRYQAAQDAADGTTAAREKARQDKADAAQKAAWAKIDKGLDAQATKQEALAVAAEKAAQALLKVQRAAIEQSPVYQASVARYNATVNPAQQTGGLDPITIIENKIANLWNTSKSESDYEKTFGILSAQLAAAIKKYGDGVQKQFDKAGKDLENNPNIPGTDAWVKALEAQWKKVAASPAVVAGLANLGKAGGLAVGGTFGGQNASAGVAATNFQNQTNLGVLGARNADTSNLVNLNVATILKDTGTQFSILDALYLKGAKGLDGLVVTLPQVVDAYKADQVTVLASTRRLIDFDKATGNTADELTQTLNLYHQGNATLAESEQAYSDNAAAVAKVTAQDLAFLEGTGQWSAALSSITSSITGPLADANAKLVIDIMSGVGAREADIASVKNLQAAQDALAQATWDEQYSVANPAQQSQMLNTLAQPMISQQSSEASAAQAMNTAQLGVIAAESALEVQGINAMTTELADMGGIIKAASALQTAQFSGQLAALNDLIPIQNDMAAIQKATTPQMLQTAQEQLKIDRLTAAMDQNKASWDVKIAQMTLQLAQDKMMVDMANADAQRTIAVDNLVLAGDALNVQIASAKLQSDSLVIQNAIHTDLGGVQDYLSLIDGDLQNLTDAQNQQMSDQGMLAGDTGYANMLAASGAAMLGGDQLGIDSATAAATAANQAYQLQLAQYKVEQNSQQNLQQLVANSTADNAALLSEVKTLQNLIAFQNSPASRRPLRSVGNVSTAAMINSWAATAAATQAA